MIIIVSGFPRSGTSMMMQILQAGGIPLLYDITMTSEANPYGPFEWSKLRHAEENSEWPSIAEGKAIKAFLPNIPKFTRELACKVIVMVRNPIEVAKSRNLKKNRPIDYELESETEIAINSLAMAKAAFADLAYPTLEVPYADIVQTPDVWLNAIIEFLSLDPANITAMRAVIKPELYRNKA